MTFWRKKKSKSVSDGESELDFLWSLVEQSLNAKKFADSCLGSGFQVVKEDFNGLTLQGQYGRLIVSVIASHHPTNIFCLLYKNEKKDQNTCLVDEGKLQDH